MPVFMLPVAPAWLFAKILGKHGGDLMRPLLLIQFLPITWVSIFSGITRPSVDPHGRMATIAAMRSSYGLSVCSLAPGAAGCALDRCHDRQSDEYRALWT